MTTGYSSSSEISGHVYIPSRRSQIPKPVTPATPQTDFRRKIVTENPNFSIKRCHSSQFQEKKKTKLLRKSLSPPVGYKRKSVIHVKPYNISPKSYGAQSHKSRTPEKNARIARFVSRSVYGLKKADSSRSRPGSRKSLSESRRGSRKSPSGSTNSNCQVGAKYRKGNSSLNVVKKESKSPRTSPAGSHKRKPIKEQENKASNDEIKRGQRSTVKKLTSPTKSQSPSNHNFQNMESENSVKTRKNQVAKNKVKVSSHSFLDKVNFKLGIDKKNSDAQNSDELLKSQDSDFNQLTRKKSKIPKSFKGLGDKLSTKDSISNKGQSLEQKRWSSEVQNKSYEAIIKDSLLECDDVTLSSDSIVKSKGALRKSLSGEVESKHSNLNFKESEIKRPSSEIKNLREETLIKESKIKGKGSKTKSGNLEPSNIHTKFENVSSKANVSGKDSKAKYPCIRRGYSELKTNNVKFTVHGMRQHGFNFPGLSKSPESGMSRTAMNQGVDAEKKFFNDEKNLSFTDLICKEYLGGNNLHFFPKNFSFKENFLSTFKVLDKKEKRDGIPATSSLHSRVSNVRNDRPEIVEPIRIERRMKSQSFDFLKSYNNIAFVGNNEEAMNIFPNTLTLYQPPENQILLYDLANCLATQAYLKLCKVNFEVVYKKNAENMSPSGKVPFIRCGNCIVSEYEPIVAFINTKFENNLEVKETDRPPMKAFMAIVNGVLDNAERFVCWFDDITLREHSKPRTAMGHPFPLNYILTWKKKCEERKRLLLQNRPEKTFDEVIKEMSMCCRHLSQRLGSRKCFFENHYCEFDALVFGHICALLSTRLRGPASTMKKMVKELPNLVLFATKMEEVCKLKRLSALDMESMIEGPGFVM